MPLFDFDPSEPDKAAAYGLIIAMVTIPALVIIAALLMTIVRLVYKLKREEETYIKDYSSDSEIKSFIKFLQRDKDYEIVHITKGSKGDMRIGICLEGGVNNPSMDRDAGIYVKKVNVGSPAAGKLYPGDRILSINDLEVLREPLRFVINIIRQARGTVKFYVKRAHQTQIMINNDICYIEEKAVETTMKQILEAFKDYEKNMAAVFTRQQIEELADGFSVYDRDGHGTVKTSQVFPLVRSLGYNLYEYQLRQYLNQLGLTAHPYITLKDFIRIMHVIVTEHHCFEEDIEMAYNVFNDGSGNGLTTGKLKQALKRIPGRVFANDTEINDILRLANGDMRNGGAIRYKDFRKLVLPTMKLY